MRDVCAELCDVSSRFFVSDLGERVEIVLRSSRELHWTFEQSTLGHAGVGYAGIRAHLEL